MIKRFLLTLLFFALLVPICYADLILHNTTKNKIYANVEWVNPPDDLIDTIPGRFFGKYLIAVGEMVPGKKWKLLWDTEDGEIFIIRWFKDINSDELISEKKVMWAKEMKDAISEPGKDLKIILKENKKEVNNGSDRLLYKIEQR